MKAELAALSDEELWIRAVQILEHDNSLVLDTRSESGYTVQRAKKPSGECVSCREDADYVACDEGGIFAVWLDIIDKIRVPFHIAFYDGAEGERLCRLSWMDAPGSQTWSRLTLQPSELAREITRMFIMTSTEKEGGEA